MDQCHPFIFDQTGFSVYLVDWAIGDTDIFFRVDWSRKTV